MTTKLMSKTLKAIQKRIEDVLLKSRMREIFTSGSVRGLIVTLGLLPQQKVGYGLYSTGYPGRIHQEIITFSRTATLDK